MLHVQCQVLAAFQHTEDVPNFGQSSGPVGVSVGVMTPRKNIGALLVHNNLGRFCETTVGRDECKVHEQEMTNSGKVSAHWARAIEPLVLVVSCRQEAQASPV